MKKAWFFVLVLVALHLGILANLQFTAWPDILSYGYLRNHGFLLYKDMIYPYPPVLVLGLRVVYKLFGYELVVLKIVTWAMILINDVLIFLIVKKVTQKKLLAILALAVYVLVQPFLEGNQLWFDLAIVPPVLLGALFFLDKKYLLGGFFWGIAALTKQTAGIFLVASALWLIISEKKFKNAIKLAVGPIVLFSVLLVRLITEGAVSGFFNWTLVYPFTYWSKFPGYVEMVLTKGQWLMIIFLSAPFAISLLGKRKLMIYHLWYIRALIQAVTSSG